MSLPEQRVLTTGDARRLSVRLSVPCAPGGLDCAGL